MKRLLEDRKYLDEKIDSYLKKGLIYNSSSPSEITGHLEKSRHNLSFLQHIKNEFSDWMLVVCYYAAYHSALALLLSKRYFSKNHDATLCILISEFYDKDISRQDIEFLNMFDIHDILFYAETKNKRKEASYSTKIYFDTAEVRDIKTKTILFVNKAEKIINSRT